MPSYTEHVSDFILVSLDLCVDEGRALRRSGVIRRLTPVPSSPRDNWTDKLAHGVESHIDRLMPIS
jgi:hypothetical protein